MKHSLFVALMILTTTSWSICHKNELPSRTQTSDIDGFSVDTPVTLLREGDVTPDSTRKYHAYTGETWLFVVSMPGKNVEHELEPVASFFRSQGHGFGIGKSISEPTMLRIKDAVGYAYSLVTFKQGDRVFVIQTVSPADDDPVVTRFLTSFSAGGHSLDAGSLVKTGETLDDRDQKQTIPGSTPSASKLSGSAGNGSGALAVQKPAPSPPTATRLKILTTPKPPYTPAASFYGISGRLLVRVVFRDDGGIGDITAVGRLPFGLTDAAVAAAKQITFEPATINGKPITQTKSVEYEFTIY